MNIITYPEKNTWADLLKRPTLQTESLRETVLEILNRIKFEGDSKRVNSGDFVFLNIFLIVD